MLPVRQNYVGQGTHTWQTGRSGCHRQLNLSVDDCKVLRELSTNPPSCHLTSVDTLLRGRFTSLVPEIAFQLPFPGGCSDCAEWFRLVHTAALSVKRPTRALSERPIKIINITYESEYAQVANRSLVDTSRRRPGTRSWHLVRVARGLCRVVYHDDIQHRESR